MGHRLGITLVLYASMAQAAYIIPTPQPTATPANTPVPTATVVPTATPPNTPVPTATIVPTATPQPTATPPVNFTYSGTLTIADIAAENASFTVAHRITRVTTGASAIVATTPASPTVGDTYTLIKIDNGAGTVVWTRSGSQTLNGATTRTISAQYGIDTCTYTASNEWLCQGSGA